MGNLVSGRTRSVRLVTMSTVKVFTFNRLKSPIESVSEKEVANPSHLETFSKFNDSDLRQQMRKFAVLKSQSSLDRTFLEL